MVKYKWRCTACKELWDIIVELDETIAEKILPCPKCGIRNIVNVGWAINAETAEIIRVENDNAG